MSTLDAFFRSLEVIIDRFLSAGEASLDDDGYPRVMTGTLSGQPVALETDLFRSRGYRQIVRARMSRQDGSGVTRTLIALPVGRLPLVGLDVVAMKDKLSLFALDLTPIDSELWESVPRKALESARLAVPTFVPREMPEFAKHTFSRAAIIGTVPPGDEASLCDAAATVLACESLVGGADERPTAEFKARQDAWLTAQRSNRKEIGAMSRIFDLEQAVAYFDRIFASSSVCLALKHVQPAPQLPVTVHVLWDRLRQSKSLISNT